MCCWFDIVRLTGRERGREREADASRTVVGMGMGMMGARRGMGMGMRGHHIFLLRHIMTAEKRVMAVAVVMAMA